MPTKVVLRIVLLMALLLGGLSHATVGSQSGSHEPTLDLTLPVAGGHFRDDYHAVRGGGTRAHRGIDIFAAAGTPVYAATGGRISWMPGRHGTAGYALQVLGTDGRTYAYYHLGPHGGGPAQAYARGLREGASVSRGQHIGYVGDSGNAVGGSPHLHFEIHDDRITDPFGTNRINPYRSLVAATQGRNAPRSGASPSRSGARDGVLRMGDSGQDVAAWQRQLNQVRSSPIGVDGLFGPQTDRATRDFQRAAGITVDGVVGSQTRSAIASGSAAPTRASDSSGSGLLRLGDRGSQVSTWQQALNRARSSSIVVDGIFGPQTDGATRSFQRSAGITVDGVVGPQTWAAIRG